MKLLRGILLLLFGTAAASMLIEQARADVNHHEHIAVLEVLADLSGECALMLKMGQGMGDSSCQQLVSWSREHAVGIEDAFAWVQEGSTTLSQRDHLTVKDAVMRINSNLAYVQLRQ